VSDFATFSLWTQTANVDSSWKRPFSCNLFVNVCLLSRKSKFLDMHYNAIVILLDSIQISTVSTFYPVEWQCWSFTEERQHSCRCYSKIFTDHLSSPRIAVSQLCVCVPDSNLWLFEFFENLFVFASRFVKLSAQKSSQEDVLHYITYMYFLPAHVPSGRQHYRWQKTITTDASEQNNTGPLGGPVIKTIK